MVHTLLSGELLQNPKRITVEVDGRSGSLRNSFVDIHASIEASPGARFGDIFCLEQYSKKVTPAVRCTLQLACTESFICDRAVVGFGGGPPGFLSRGSDLT